MPLRQILRHPKAQAAASTFRPKLKGEIRAPLRETEVWKGDFRGGSGAVGCADLVTARKVMDCVLEIAWMSLFGSDYMPRRSGATSQPGPPCNRTIPSASRGWSWGFPVRVQGRGGGCEGQLWGAERTKAEEEHLR